MDFDIEQGKKLIDELMDLWFECSIRCDKIEELIKQINENLSKHTIHQPRIRKL